MKKLILLLFIPLVSLGQGDFRKMNWGDSVEDLKKSYPDINFNKKNKLTKYGMLEISQTAKLLGIDVEIVYSFYNDSLVFGGYNFKPTQRLQPTNEESFDNRLEDFIKIEEMLLEKYPSGVYSKDYRGFWLIINNEELNYRYMRLELDNEGNPIKPYERLEKTVILHIVNKQSYNQHFLSYSSKRFGKIVEEYKKNELMEGL